MFEEIDRQELAAIKKEGLSVKEALERGFNPYTVAQIAKTTDEFLMARRASASRTGEKPKSAALRLVNQQIEEEVGRRVGEEGEIVRKLLNIRHQLSGSQGTS